MCEGLKGGREGEGEGGQHTVKAVLSSVVVHVFHADLEACCSVVPSSWAADLGETCREDKCQALHCTRKRC